MKIIKTVVSSNWAAQIQNKINHLEKNKIDVDNPKEFINNNNGTLKTQHRFISERHNVLAEEINKILLRSDDERRMQSIDSIETYVYGINKEQINVTIW